MPVLFLAFWIILNSRVTLEVVVIGVFVSALMSLFAYRLVGISFSAEKKLWTKSWKIAAYLAMLLWEIIKANFQMVRIILSPKIEIHPLIVYFQSPVRTDFAKIMLTYSIMLTPGTVIFELEGDRLGIHAIDSTVIIGGADDSIFSTFVHRLRDIEGGY